MTPREKAVELIYKFGMETQYYERTKQCALIAVDELIQDNAISEILVNGGLQKVFWEEVKQEIEKL